MDGSLLCTSKESRRKANQFIKNHVSSKNMIPFSVSYENQKRHSVAFLSFLKSLPNICQYYLSRINERNLPVNVKEISVTPLYDLKKIHEIFTSFSKASRKRSRTEVGLCEMYDENLNLITN